MTDILKSIFCSHQKFCARCIFLLNYDLPKARARSNPHACIWNGTWISAQVKQRPQSTEENQFSLPYETATARLAESQGQNRCGGTLPSTIFSQCITWPFKVRLGQQQVQFTTLRRAANPIPQEVGGGILAIPLEPFRRNLLVVQIKEAALSHRKLTRDNAWYHLNPNHHFCPISSNNETFKLEHNCRLFNNCICILQAKISTFMFLTQENRLLLEKLIVAQLLKRKFPAF